MREPVISVIVLTYNHENYVRGCLESILCQKVSVPIEILVSDDASADRTPEILQEYKERFPEKIKLTLRTENVGATRNSYELLLQAKGKYLAFCEGDDFWCDENKLQTQYDFMEAHPQYIGCSHKIRLVDKNGVPKKKQRLYWTSEKKVFRLRDFQGIFLPGHASSWFRRNIYLSGEDFSIQYRANRNIGDRTVALLYLARGEFYHLDSVMSCYRQVAEAGGNNLSSSLYVGNEESVKLDFEYTLRLEAYAKEHIEQSVDFDYHKCELLLRILHGKAGKKDTKLLAKSIYNSMQKKRRMVLLSAKILWKKICRG
ncbi:MAG: glycosyltransferase [Lachnospiraceae bacterium]